MLLMLDRRLVAGCLAAAHMHANHIADCQVELLDGLVECRMHQIELECQLRLVGKLLLHGPQLRVQKKHRNNISFLDVITGVDIEIKMMS